ncbi:MAG TPA: hypothetical protein VFK50_10710 [Sphingomicrobium sp.]|nr:hypothetical protein [Sphingomicrobium sp.]
MDPLYGYATRSQSFGSHWDEALPALAFGFLGWFNRSRRVTHGSADKDAANAGNKCGTRQARHQAVAIGHSNNLHVLDSY